MKYDVAMKWVEALRSGKYKQGKDRLRNHNNEFCCLGVLCDISEQGEWVKNEYDDNFAYLESNLTRNTVFLPWTISNKLEIKDVSFLISMNDMLDNSFTEIADYIEKNWETL